MTGEIPSKTTCSLDMKPDDTPLLSCPVTSSKMARGAKYNHGTQKRVAAEGFSANLKMKVSISL